ncbi:MAG: precorrin-6A/cobalt-precorrin-6A reductase [Cyanobacteriota bacterium]|nr:precorrin-6A/cobalt-precorrin-6A reductase [Cyanobacteriota bacterium]
MHRPTQPCSPRVWLIAGTGDGLQLALVLQQLGWRLQVSVVTQEAARRYPRHPDLRVVVGAIEDPLELREPLERAWRDGDPFLAVVDASHPFASQITARLAQLWERMRSSASAELSPRHLPPLFRLRRRAMPTPALSQLRLLPDLEALASVPLQGRRLLLAVGSRQLGRAVSCSSGALHHARLPSTPMALQQGLSAGLQADRIACLRPGDPEQSGVLRALVIRWQIDTILCRQSGGITEALWRSLAAEQDLALLLLARPAEPESLIQLEWEPLLEALRQLRDA